MQTISKVIYALQSGQNDLCLEVAKTGGPEIGRACVRYILEGLTGRNDASAMELEQKETMPKFELVNKLKDLNLATNKEILFEACRNGNVELARNLVEAHPEYIDGYDNYCYQFTVLHWSCQSGSVELCRLLLKHRSPTFHINARETKFGSTALHMAYYTGKVEIYKALLEAGADANVVNKFGETSLHLAAKRGYAECCQLLLDYNALVDAIQKSGNTALHWAALHHVAPKEDGNVRRLHPVCEVLIKAGTDVNKRNRDGATPLHMACKKGNLAACLSLVATKVADVNCKGKTYTPLHFAAYNGHTKICEALLEAGADATILEDKIGSALHCAASKGHAKVCKLLVEHSTSLLELKDRGGRTALDLARATGNSEVLEALTKLKHAKKQRNDSLPDRVSIS